jgi:predicted alternative tryptophan synthase beta-subunit
MTETTRFLLGNFGGFALPFVRENLTGGRSTQIVAVDPAAAPSLTKGRASCGGLTS